MKIIRPIIIFSTILFFTPWFTSYAYGVSNAAPGNEAIRVEAAPAAEAPSAAFFGMAIGVVTPGNLFYIDATGQARDINIDLYLTNIHELAPCLRYFIIKIGVYTESDGGWQKATSWDGTLPPDTFMTLRNSPASFRLPGYAKYKITVDAGSFYCMTADTGGKPISPQFYLAIEDA